MKEGTRLAIGDITYENIRFILASFVLLLITHAIAYLTHEYSHSLMAWSLGWMADPFGIDYGNPTLYNFIFLDDVSDNVQYLPIFSSGHGTSAAIIALSGPFLGNGLLYFIVYSVAKRAAISSSRTSISFAYWLSLMCAGNVWGYVPLRAITTHADIALAAQGLKVSSWTLFPFLIIPSLYIVYHFFCKMFPLCQQKISAGSGNDFITLITLTSFWFFSFFGGDGITGNYGLTSQILGLRRDTSSSRFARYTLHPNITLTTSPINNRLTVAACPNGSRVPSAP